MGRPYDLTKTHKFVDKSIPGISYGFNDPSTWIDTGCYLLNYLVSNRFDGGLPLEGKFCMLAGDSGSGKSFIAVANLIKWCQEHGVWPVLIDTENALDMSWLEPLGVDTSEDGMDKYLGSTIDDVSKLLGFVIESYKEANISKPYKDRGKMVIIIDSIGMLITPNQDKQFMEGDQKGDLGIKAKQVTAMIRVMMSKIGSQPIGLVGTNHVFDAQDKYKPDSIAGGKMLEFASSVIVQMNKLLLKQDENGKDLEKGVVSGIRSSCVVRKSRYAKPFEKVFIDIPYDRGMNRYSGLFDLFEKKHVITKQGNRYSYTSPVTGEVFLLFRKEYRPKGLLDQIMAEWEHWENPTTAVGFDETLRPAEDFEDDEDGN